MNVFDFLDSNPFLGFVLIVGICLTVGKVVHDISYYASRKGIAREIRKAEEENK